MTLTNQRAAFTDCYALYQSAVDSPRGAGVRTPFPAYNKARFFSLRMNHARLLQRRDNRRIYPQTHPLYDTSDYDHLQVVVRGPDPNNEWWVEVKPHAQELAYVEPLADDDSTPLSLPSPTLALTNTEDDLA